MDWISLFCPGCRILKSRTAPSSYCLTTESTEGTEFSALRFNGTEPTSFTRQYHMQTSALLFFSGSAKPNPISVSSVFSVVYWYSIPKGWMKSFTSLYLKRYGEVVAARCAHQNLCVFGAVRFIYCLHPSAIVMKEPGRVRPLPLPAWSAPVCQR